MSTSGLPSDPSAMIATAIILIHSSCLRSFACYNEGYHMGLSENRGYPVNRCQIGRLGVVHPILWESKHQMDGHGHPKH